MPPRLAIVTATEARGFDDDLEPLLGALSDLGPQVEVEVVDWDDPTADWSAFGAALIRSTWDYTQRHDEFLAWTRRCGAATRLVNGPDVIAWNSDKRYLRDLAQAGVRVVPSQFFGPDDVLDAAALPADVDLVVKPAVSAGSRDTIRHETGGRDSAVRHAAKLAAAGRTALVQPYQEAVDREGETALLYFGGRFSHAVRKAPLLLVTGELATQALFAEEIITPAEADPEQRALADGCLAALAQVPALAGTTLPLPYARVDVLTDNDGRCSVLELELIEPSVFLPWSPGAAEQFAAVVLAAVVIDAA